MLALGGKLGTSVIPQQKKQGNKQNVRGRLNTNCVFQSYGDLHMLRTLNGTIPISPAYYYACYNRVGNDRQASVS